MAARQKKPPMDGAQYWSKDAVPADYMAGEDGIRPKEKIPPKGEMTTMLDAGIAFAPLPPRSIWRTGAWKTLNLAADGDDEDYRTWVVSGEGTPGNFEKRNYVVPAAIAADVKPRHPADWPKALQVKAPQKQTQTTYGQTKASPLPVGIRFRCPGCGHWYKEIDLAGHAKVCPGTNADGNSDWAIGCECCLSLDDTAKCKEGYPRKKAEAPPEPKAAAPEPEAVKAMRAKKPKEVAPDGGGSQAA